MDYGQLTDRLVSWIRGQADAAGSEGVVAGISGGIDSSVVIALCKRAYPDNCLGVMMPCYSNPEDAAHAELVADKFAVSTELVTLDSVFDSLLGVLPSDGEAASCSQRVTANFKARLRMISLYYFANQLEYLVVGSGNRSELAVGYFTKYGDGGVDVLPLGNLVKGQVRELARYLGVPSEIIDKPPSAGLWPGQTDEAELGFSYDELDEYLVSGQAPTGLKARLEAKATESAHKLQTPPIAPITDGG